MATVYIKPGTGTGTGTLADPYFYSQLSSAETAAGPGGTILFTDGDYEISNTATWDGVGTSGNDITYKSLNPLGAVIKSDTSGTLRPLILGDNTSNTSTFNLQDFKLIDLSLTIKNGGSGTISGNQIGCSTGIALPAQGFIAEGNGAVSGDSAMINNSIHIKYASGTYFTFKLGQLGSFMGNTFYISGLNGKSANSVSMYSATNDFADLPVDKSINNIWATDDTANNVVSTSVNWSAFTKNNCFHQFGTNNTSGGTDNIFADPQFVDPANGDLRLRPSSPCINAGA